MGRAFDPFFTTKPVGKGTRLGLSQVDGFAARKVRSDFPIPPKPYQIHDLSRALAQLESTGGRRLSN